MRRASVGFRTLAVWLAAAVALSAFSFDFVRARAAEASIDALPQACALLRPSTAYDVPLLKGVSFNDADPSKLTFIIDGGDNAQLAQSEVDRISEYFLAALTTPEKDLWVNLSPYEQDRVIDGTLEQTQMGEDFLKQDYVLKQLASSLTSPDTKTGHAYWAEAEANGADLSAVNKVWIVPEKAHIYAKGNAVLINESSLDVLTEHDYLAAQKIGKVDTPASLAAFKRHVLPAIKHDVNTGKSFARLRQMYSALILGVWLKDKLVSGAFAGYTDAKAVGGINDADAAIKSQVLARYADSFRKGVYDTVKQRPAQKEKAASRRYFSGGLGLEHLSSAIVVDAKPAVSDKNNNFRVELQSSPLKQYQPFDKNDVSTTLMTLKIDMRDNDTEFDVFVKAVKDMMAVLAPSKKDFRELKKKLKERDPATFEKLMSELNADRESAHPAAILLRKALLQSVVPATVEIDAEVLRETSTQRSDALALSVVLGLFNIWTRTIAGDDCMNLALLDEPMFGNARMTVFDVAADKVANYEVKKDVVQKDGLWTVKEHARVGMSEKMYSFSMFKMSSLLSQLRDDVALSFYNRMDKAENPAVRETLKKSGDDLLSHSKSAWFAYRKAVELDRAADDLRADAFRQPKKISQKMVDDASEAALRQYEAALQIWPTNVRFIRLYASALVRHGLYDQAATEIEKALKIRPSDARTWLDYAQIVSSAKIVNGKPLDDATRNDLAVSAIRSALKIDPQVLAHAAADFRDGKKSAGRLDLKSLAYATRLSAAFGTSEDYTVEEAKSVIDVYSYAAVSSGRRTADVDVVSAYLYDIAALGKEAADEALERAPSKKSVVSAFNSDGDLAVAAVRTWFEAAAVKAQERVNKAGTNSVDVDNELTYLRGIEKPVFTLASKIFQLAFDVLQGKKEDRRHRPFDLDSTVSRELNLLTLRYGLFVGSYDIHEDGPDGWELQIIGENGFKSNVNGQSVYAKRRKPIGNEKDLLVSIAEQFYAKPDAERKAYLAELLQQHGDYLYGFIDGGDLSLMITDRKKVPIEYRAHADALKADISQHFADLERDIGAEAAMKRLSTIGATFTEDKGRKNMTMWAPWAASTKIPFEKGYTVDQLTKEGDGEVVRHRRELTHMIRENQKFLSGAISEFEQIVEKGQLQGRLAQVETYDSMIPQLLRNKIFYRRVAAHLEKGEFGALAFGDVDFFKNINEGIGVDPKLVPYHTQNSTGDIGIIQFGTLFKIYAERFAEQFGIDSKTMLLSHVSGDEFLAFFPGASNDQAARLLSAVRAAIEKTTERVVRTRNPDGTLVEPLKDGDSAGKYVISAVVPEGLTEAERELWKQNMSQFSNQFGVIDQAQLRPDDLIHTIPLRSTFGVTRADNLNIPSEQWRSLAEAGSKVAKNIHARKNVVAFAASNGTLMIADQDGSVGTAEAYAQKYAGKSLAEIKKEGVKDQRSGGAAVSPSRAEEDGDRETNRKREEADLAPEGTPTAPTPTIAVRAPVVSPTAPSPTIAVRAPAVSQDQVSQSEMPSEVQTFVRVYTEQLTLLKNKLMDFTAESSANDFSSFDFEIGALHATAQQPGQLVGGVIRAIADATPEIIVLLKKASAEFRMTRNSNGTAVKAFIERYDAFMKEYAAAPAQTAVVRQADLIVPDVVATVVASHASEPAKTAMPSVSELPPLAFVAYNAAAEELSDYLVDARSRTDKLLEVTSDSTDFRAAVAALIGGKEEDPNAVPLFRTYQAAVQAYVALYGRYAEFSAVKEAFDKDLASEEERLRDHAMWLSEKDTYMRRMVSEELRVGRAVKDLEDSSYASISIDSVRKAHNEAADLIGEIRKQIRPVGADDAELLSHNNTLSATLAEYERRINAALEISEATVSVQNSADAAANTVSKRIDAYAEMVQAEFAGINDLDAVNRNVTGQTNSIKAKAETRKFAGYRAVFAREAIQAVYALRAAILKATAAHGDMTSLIAAVNSLSAAYRDAVAQSGAVMSENDPGRLVAQDINSAAEGVRPLENSGTFDLTDLASNISEMAALLAGKPIESVDRFRKQTLTTALLTSFAGETVGVDKRSIDEKAKDVYNRLSGELSSYVKEAENRPIDLASFRTVVGSLVSLAERLKMLLSQDKDRTEPEVISTNKLFVRLYDQVHTSALGFGNLLSRVDGAISRLMRANGVYDQAMTTYTTQIADADDAALAAAKNEYTAARSEFDAAGAELRSFTAGFPELDDYVVAAEAAVSARDADIAQRLRVRDYNHRLELFKAHLPEGNLERFVFLADGGPMVSQFAAYGDDYLAALEFFAKGLSDALVNEFRGAMLDPAMIDYNQDLFGRVRPYLNANKGRVFGQRGFEQIISESVSRLSILMSEFDRFKEEDRKARDAAYWDKIKSMPQAERAALFLRWTELSAFINRFGGTDQSKIVELVKLLPGDFAVAHAKFAEILLKETGGMGTIGETVDALNNEQGPFPAMRFAYMDNLNELVRIVAAVNGFLPKMGYDKVSTGCDVILDDLTSAEQGVINGMFNEAFAPFLSIIVESLAEAEHEVGTGTSLTVEKYTELTRKFFLARALLTNMTWKRDDDVMHKFSLPIQYLQITFAGLQQRIEKLSASIPLPRTDKVLRGKVYSFAGSDGMLADPGIIESMYKWVKKTLPLDGHIADLLIPLVDEKLFKQVGGGFASNLYVVRPDDSLYPKNDPKKDEKKGAKKDEKKDPKDARPLPPFAYDDYGRAYIVVPADQLDIFDNMTMLRRTLEIEIDKLRNDHRYSKGWGDFLLEYFRKKVVVGGLDIVPGHEAMREMMYGSRLLPAQAKFVIDAYTKSMEEIAGEFMMANSAFAAVSRDTMCSPDEYMMKIASYLIRRDKLSGARYLQNVKEKEQMGSLNAVLASRGLKLDDSVLNEKLWNRTVMDPRMQAYTMAFSSQLAMLIADMYGVRKPEQVRMFAAMPALAYSAQHDMSILGSLSKSKKSIFSGKLDPASVGTVYQVKIPKGMENVVDLKETLVLSLYAYNPSDVAFETKKFVGLIDQLNDEAVEVAKAAKGKKVFDDDYVRGLISAVRDAVAEAFVDDLDVVIAPLAALDAAIARYAVVEIPQTPVDEKSTPGDPTSVQPHAAQVVAPVVSHQVVVRSHNADPEMTVTEVEKKGPTYEELMRQQEAAAATSDVETIDLPGSGEVTPAAVSSEDKPFTLLDGTVLDDAFFDSIPPIPSPAVSPEAARVSPVLASIVSLQGALASMSKVEDITKGIREISAMIEPGKISAEEKTALLALVDAAGKRSNEIMEDAFDHDFNNAPMVMMAIANPPDGYQFAEKELLAKVASSELKQREVQGGLDMGRISSMIKADGGAISLGKKLAVHSCDGVTLKVVSMKKVTARQVMAVFV